MAFGSCGSRSKLLMMAGISPLRRRQGGFPIAPLTPSARILPCGLIFVVALGNEKHTN